MWVMRVTRPARRAWGMCVPPGKPKVWYSSGTYNWHRLYVLMPISHPPFQQHFIKNAKIIWLFVPAQKQLEIKKCQFICAVFNFSAAARPFTTFVRADANFIWSAGIWISKKCQLYVPAKMPIICTGRRILDANYMCRYCSYSS